MKNSVLILLTILAVSACTHRGSSLSNPESIGDHYQANHCELFLDKVTPVRGSHGSVGVTLYIKTLNSRLDGRIDEVGFRRQVIEIANSAPHRRSVSPWTNAILSPSNGASDYFTTSLTLGSSYGSASYEGVFYVKTDKGTHYWLKPRTGGNYLIDRGLMGLWNFNDPLDAYAERSSQDTGALSKFNPDRCR